MATARNFLTTLALVLLLSVSGSAVADESIAGDWEGTIAQQLRIVFHITADDEGNLAATFDSPDQGAFGVAFDSVEYADGKLTLQFAAAGASYAGAISEDNSKLEGTWTQGGQNLPLEMARQQ